MLMAVPEAINRGSASVDAVYGWALRSSPCPSAAGSNSPSHNWPRSLLSSSEGKLQAEPAVFGPRLSVP